MNIKRIKIFRNITLCLWLFVPFSIFLIPIINKVTGSNEWGGMFLVFYMVVCCGCAYKLQKYKCPSCNEYMFRGGKLKYAFQNFLFRKCGHCGFGLKDESSQNS